MCSTHDHVRFMNCPESRDGDAPRRTSHWSIWSQDPALRVFLSMHEPAVAQGRRTALGLGRSPSPHLGRNHLHIASTCACQCRAAARAGYMQSGEGPHDARVGCRAERGRMARVRASVPSTSTSRVERHSHSVACPTCYLPCRPRVAGCAACQTMACCAVCQTTASS